jgi:phage tail sheath protein FI
MPEYITPGVYIEEIRTGSVPILGVRTSTAGFVGQTERGPATPRLVTSWLDYQQWFGGPVDTSLSYLPWAVKGFFDNRGRRAFVARVTATGSRPAALELPTSDGGQILRLEAVGDGAWGNNIFACVSQPQNQIGTEQRVRLTLIYYTNPPDPLLDPLDPANVSNPARRDPDYLEEYPNLGLHPQTSSSVLTTLNAASHLVEASWTAADQPPALPNAVAFADARLEGGNNGPDSATVADYQGHARSGLTALGDVDEIALLCIPDEVKVPLEPLREALLLQCERLKDRFAVLQERDGQGNPEMIRVSRASGYGATYWPWIRVSDPRTQDTLLVPPGGHVLGIYTRTDLEQGAHKAPANEEIRGIVTRDLPGNLGPLEFKATKEAQDILNPRGINVIRDFRADRRGIRIWGARTIADDAQWRYVNVRRLFIFLEESIDKGTKWVVSEPNEATWAKVRQSITSFLQRVWRDGALAGITAEEAFFVRCDRTTMTQDDIENGRLICYIGVAPVKPADSVIFRISQKTLEAAPASGGG